MMRAGQFAGGQRRWGVGAVLGAGFLAGVAAARPAAAPASAAVPGLTVATVLEKVRQATGYAELARFPHGIRASGPAELLGNKVSETLWIHADGRFARRYSGPVPHADGANGKDAWQIEFSGQPRILELGERAVQLITGAALSGAWLAPDSAFRLKLDDEKTDAQVVTLAFTIRTGHEQGTIEIDRETWRPRQWKFGAPAARQHTLQFSGVREFEGLRLPAEILDTSDHGHGDPFALETVTATPPAERAACDPPAAPTGDLRFDALVPAELRVERAPTGHLLVEPRLNGRAGGWFIFDTGAGASVLTTALVDEVAAQQIGTVQAVGVGGAVEAPICRLEALELGPLTLARPVVVGIDLSFLTFPLGRPIAGVIGYDVISRCVVEFDIAAGRIALHDPARYAGTTEPWRHLYLPDRIPAIEAEFEGHRGPVRLDTGAAGTYLTLHYPAVAGFKLLEGRDTRVSRSGGVGGGVETRVGRLKYFEFGGKRFEDLEVGFVTEPKGTFASPYTAGVVGAPLIRQFTLVFDYSRARIALRPCNPEGKVSAVKVP